MCRSANILLFHEIKANFPRFVLRALDLPEPTDFEADFPETAEMDGAFQNRIREGTDPIKYYTYDLRQSRGSGTWKAVSISEAGGKGFNLGVFVARYELKDGDGSNATGGGVVDYDVASMVVSFDTYVCDIAAEFRYHQRQIIVENHEAPMV
ncbi:hypothetical protein HOY82DRAFT_598022 [Tuber indicum]|nr:hypothetical protein HOY82DRAFT_598022 [Tuber indicum]